MTSLKWKRKIGQCWPASNYRKKIILLYHSVGDSAWAMSKSNFLDQMHWLFDHCRIISLPDLIQTEKSDELQVALTFDDGYQSLHDQVAPLLSAKRLNAAVYINTGWISEDDSTRRQSVATLGHYPDETFLTWREVENLNKAGWLIGSHGVNHHNFSLMDEKLTLQEFSQSKNAIEAHLNVACPHFAYPFGRYKKSVKDIAKQVGYQYAVAARHGSIGYRPDLLALPRINIEKNYSLNDFKNILKGKWDYLAYLHRVKGL